MTVEIAHGDISQEDVDVIVNAANSSLMGGGGVDGAIHKAAGPQVLDECRAISIEQGGCPTGSAVITNAGELKAKYIVHAVGPVWKGGKSDEDNLLISTYATALQLAEEHGAKSIAFPNISTGIYGFPRERAVKIVGDLIKKIIPNLNSLELIRFVCYEEENYLLYKKELGTF